MASNNHNDAACDAEVRTAMMGGENGSNGIPASATVVTPVLPAGATAGSAATTTPAAGTKARKITKTFKITNVLPSRPPSNDQEDSGEEDEGGNGVGDDGRGRKNGIADPHVCNIQTQVSLIHV